MYPPVEPPDPDPTTNQISSTFHRMRGKKRAGKREEK